MRPEDYQPDYQALTALPPQPPPKPPKGGGLAIPDWRKSAEPGKAQIQKPSFNVANVDLTSTYRNGATSIDTIRSLSRVNPELNASQAAHNRVGIPEKFIAIARDPDGSFNVDATRLAMQLLRQMNTMADYDNGFSHVGSLRSVSEALGKQIQQTGAMGLELVLDKSRLPSQFMPVDVTHLIFFEDGNGTRPVQRIGGKDIDLDIATFFYVALDPDLRDAYPQSPLEAAIQPVLGSTTFLNDLRRVCGRAVYPRIDISIDEEKLRARIPRYLLNDETALTAYLNGVIADVEAAVNNLGVEEALVHYDFFEYKYVDGTQADMSKTFDGVQNILNGKMSTAMKTPATILGHGNRAASAADADIQLFMLNANGMIRLKLQELYSKAMTLAVRLFGLDVTVAFEFDEIELRPKSELMAYRQMAYEYWTNLLSLGLVTDEEVCLRLTGELPPKGYTPRMGTDFKNPVAVAPAANPDSQTSNLGANRNKAPTQPKGPAK
jgi:hypothetical protein